MDILQYLIELLKTRKQIGIEGLGTLYKKKTPGRYDAETHSFLPPSYVLEFTSDMLENSNLVQYIQSKRGISEDSAKYFISQFVNQTQEALQQGSYNLENLGTLRQRDEQIIFTPKQDINIGFDFFALPSITAELPKIEPSASLDEEVTEETVSEEIHSEITDITAKNTPQKITEPEIEQVKVPEFEQELNRVADEVEAENVSNYEEEEISEDTTEEDVSEEDVSEEESDNNNEATIKEDSIPTEEQTESIENNEATQEEVFEEIAEVNTAILATETQQNKQEESDDWNFEGENVVSESDILDEEINKNEYKGASNETSDVSPTYSYQANFGAKEDDHNIKLTATTNDWDFDSTGTTKEEDNLIGEFDTDKIEETPKEERIGMSLFQKLNIALAILLVIIAIAYFFKPSLFENIIRDTNNPDPDQKTAVQIKDNLKTQQDSLDFADSIMQTAEKVGLDVQPAKDTLTATATPRTVNTTTYEIVGAALGNNKEVAQYIANVKRIGLIAKEIPGMPGKLRKISVASYNNKDSAMKDLKKYRQLLKNQEIYIFPNKNN